MEGIRRREVYLDAVKGMGILGVVASHCLSQTSLGAISDWYGFFMLAVFFVYTGWRYELKYKGKATGITTREMFKRRLVSLGIPYVCYSALFLICRVFLMWPEEYTVVELMANLYYAGTLIGLETLWFLPCMFITELLLNQVYGKGKLMAVSAGAAGILSVILIMYINRGREDTTLWRIVHLPVMVYIKGIIGFVLAAGGAGAYNQWGRFCTWAEMKGGRRAGTGVAVILAAVGIFMAWYVPGCDFNYLTMDNPVSWILTAWFVSFSILALGERMSGHGHRFRLLVQVLSYYGKHSLVVMCTHLTPITAFFHMAAGRSGYPGLLEKTPWDILLFGTVLLVETGLIWFIEGYAPWMNGIRPQERATARPNR